MKSILLIGLGRFGRHIARKLSELRHEVMAVDIDEKRVEAMLPYVTKAIGDNFQSSLETTSLLKEMGAALVVSRASRDRQKKFLLKNGADVVIYPERQLGEWTAMRYSSDHIFDYVELDGEHAIFEVSIPREWFGKTIGQIDVRNKYNINIMALKHNGVMQLNITSDTLLSSEYTMLVLGRIKDVQKCFHI